jgi:amino acid adenylation domain-containing protein/thioester reductase-like protein
MNNQNLQSQQTIVSLIESICQKYPENAALVLEEKQLTYGEFQQRSEHLYNYLTAQGLLKPNSLVGLCIEPSFEMVIAIYTILKAGAAFVPLDPDLPRQRLSYTITDAKLTTILTQHKFAFDVEPALRQSGLNGRMCFLDSPEVWQNEEISSPVPIVETDQLAYVIYTSGSTGEPKGVAIAHRGLLNLAESNHRIFNINPGLRLLQFASISFDAAVWEIVTALCSGATLVLSQREQLLPGKPLANFLTKYQIEMLCLPPSVLATLTEFRDDLSNLKLIVVAGEACPLSLARVWASSNTAFFNAYGPTEVTVCATIHAFNPQDSSLPIGYALPNVELYVLDEELRLCNRGEKGELYVGGVGVAQGYLGKPDLTSTRFLDNLYGSGKIYKTGDVVYEDVHYSGLLHYVGRTDNQVKVRGKRVELEAIEMVLAQHPDIQTVVVQATRATRVRSTDAPHSFGMSMLVAYIVPCQGKFLTSTHLQRFAAEQLPEYMVPVRFVFMDELPLLPNRSKIDRNALPELEQILSFASNNTDDSIKIATIFDTVLQLSPGSCQPDTNFFNMGGDSLSIAHLLHKIECEFGVSLPSRFVYEYPTALSLATAIAQHKLKCSHEVEERYIDLRAEVKLPINLDTSVWQQPAQTRYDCALITGSTGFLGAYLLYELLNKGCYQQIYCLVRAQSDNAAMVRLQETFIKYQLPTVMLSKVQAIAGDIEQPQLDLPTALYNKLGKEVDQIYHVAADTNYIKPYSAIKKPNLDGTANIITLAAHIRHKALHYVSTLAIYGALATLAGTDEVTEEFDIDKSASIISVEMGYILTKWVAERMLQSAKQKGLSVSIYRPGYICGHRQTGVANLNDMLYRLIRGCIQMGVYPDCPEKYWIPVPVDYVAAVIAHISLDTQTMGKNYNITVPRENELSHVEIFETINNLGYRLEKISLKNWLNALSGISSTNPLFPLISFLQEKVYQNRSTILEVHHRTPVFRADNTLNGIEGTTIYCPKIDKELIALYLEFINNVSRENIAISLR